MDYGSPFPLISGRVNAVYVSSLVGFLRYKSYSNDLLCCDITKSVLESQQNHSRLIGLEKWRMSHDSR